MRLLKKIGLVIFRNIIKYVDCISPRKYMTLYNWYLKQSGVQLHGVPRFIHPSVSFDGKGLKLTHLGDNIVISRNVLLLNHDYSITCGLRCIGEEIQKEAFWLKEIRIGNNVFIGANVSILPGTIIGNNCIIGTGAVVKGNYEDDSILIGNPAKIVGNTSEWAKKKKVLGDYFFET